MRPSAYRVRQLLNRLRWIHQGIGTWLFIIGSAGMLIGNLGSVIVSYQVENSDDHRPALSREHIEPIG